MAPKRTMRRVPEDVAEAIYIRDLISADVNAKAGELAAGGPDTQDQLYVLMEYKKRWTVIVNDLTDEAKGAPAATPSSAPKPPATPPPTDAKAPSAGGTADAVAKGPSDLEVPQQKRANRA